MRNSSRKKQIRIIFFLILILCSKGFYANSQEHPLTKSFDIRTEVTRPKILKVLIDRNGLLWTGTDNGVFTFDGINFNKIPDSDIINNAVTTLFEDKSGIIWVGHENGKILCIENYHARLFNPEEGVPKSSISSFGQDGDGKLCFATKGEGLYFVDKRLFNINTDDGLSDNYCYAMVRMPDGKIAVGTDAGLSFVNFKDGKKTVVTIGTSEGLPDEIVRTLTCEGNILWIGLESGGIAKFDCRNKNFIPFQLNFPWKYGPVSKILVIDNQLWIKTESEGVITLDKEGKTLPVNLSLEKEVQVNDLEIDFENNVWIAESLHLLRTTGQKLSMIEQVGGKKIKQVHCILSDKFGNIWFTPDQQLASLKKGPDGNYVLSEYKIVNKADIVTLYFDPYGYLWIGTLGEGVFRFNPTTGKARKVTSATDVESSSILSITGKENTVWVGGFNSVTQFLIESNGNSDDAVIKKVPVFNGSELLSDYVYSVFIDSKGITWFGTDASGIYRLEKGILSVIAIPGIAIHGFTEDKKGRIWFATADAGIGYIDEQKQIHRINTKDGLSDPTPTAIACVENGHLLVVHGNGFDVLDPETGDVFYHSSEENLDNINGDINSLSIAPDKSVWIGTEKGILHYKPDRDAKHNHPSVIIRKVSVFLNQVNLNTKKEFAADENNFSFDYSALWYTDPQRLNYLFKLEGYSTKWEKTKDQTITFPKLPPGKYLFRIKASINNNFERSKETTLSFKVLRPFWQTWIFRIIASALIASIIVLIVKRREKQLRNYERLEKEKIKFQFETLRSQVNPHFLFNSFNTLISVIEDHPDHAVEYVEKLSEFFRNIVVYRDKNLVPLSEELELLDNYIFIQKERYGENLKLDITIDQKSKHDYSVPPLTLQMLAENAIKHNAVSRETPLVISITNKNEMLLITNNLNPKITNEKSAGFGLENIKARFALLTKHEITVTKNNEIFRVMIPLIKTEDERTDS